MKPALAQVCSLNSPFEKDIPDYAAGQCRAVELWLGKLEAFMESHPVEEIRQLLARNEMSAPVASFQGGLLSRDREACREHWQHFEKRLSLCRQIGIETLIIVADFSAAAGGEEFERAMDGLRQASARAAGAGVALALEFQAHAHFGNNLQTAAAVVDQVGHPNLGLCLDAFHYYCGPSKADDLVLLSNENLFHVQLCDLAGTPRETATDADRVLPGDGDFVLEPIVETLRRIGYGRYVSIEVMNPQIWAVPARQFGEIGMTALRKVLGLASMGQAELGFT